MFVPEWLVGAIAAIGVEIVLLVGYAIYLVGKDDDE